MGVSAAPDPFAEDELARLTGRPERIRALLAHARRRARGGEPRRALELAGEAMGLARVEGDEHARAEAAQAMGDAQLAASSYAEGLEHYFDALEIWRGLGERAGQAHCLQGIGAIDMYVGDYALALGRFDTALQLLEGDVDPATEALVYHRLGMVYARLGELAKAGEFYELALERRRRLGNEEEAAASLNSLGVLFLRLGEMRQARGEPFARDEFERARNYFLKAQALARSSGDVHLEALALGNVGSALAFMGHLAEALPLFEQQLSALRAIHDRHDEALCLTNIAEALRLGGRPEEALPLLDEALAIGNELQSRGRLLRTYLERSRCHEALGDVAAALAAFKEHHRLDQLLRSEDAETRARDLLAQMAVRKVRQEADTYRLERDRLVQDNLRLSEAANEDALTGLPNRRRLDDSLGRLFADAHANARPLTVALGDVDHFKSINDRFSHGVGDEVLRVVARLLRNCCRPSDLAARYGGEEFVMALVDTPLPAAYKVGERLRSAISAHPWHEIQPGLEVTISIGIAEAGAHATCAELLAAADRHLYLAKNAGRDCVR